MSEKSINDLASENRLLRDQVIQIYKRYEEKISEISIVRELGMSLFHIQEFQKVCDYILEVIISNTVAQNCSIMLYDDERDQLFLLCATNPGKKSYILESEKVLSKKDVTYTFKLGEGIAGRSILEKKSILLNQVKASDGTFGHLPESQISINSLLSVPLLVGEKAIGVINVSHADKDIFDKNDVYLFEVLSGFVSILIYNSINFEKLQNSESNYRILSELSNNGIAMIQDSVHYYANPKYQEISGYSLKELKEITIDSLYELSDTKADFRQISESLTGERDNKVLTAQMNTKGMGKIDVEISVFSINYNGKTRLILSVLDITDRKILERQLIQSQKMQSIGTIAGGIAHNFNNLLMGIQGNATIAQFELSPSHPCMANLKNIEELVKNGSNLTNQLLGYAREGKFEVKPVNMNRLVQSTSTTFGAARKDIRIHLELTDKVFGVLADQGQLEQTLLNLYVNAADAMPDGGDLYLKTINITDTEIKEKSYNPRPGDYILIIVKDTGVGMEKATMERIFEPFFTTKGMAKGTGLGLASVYGIIKGHGGYIDVESEKGHGTTFNIYLPTTTEEIECDNDLGDELHIGRGVVLLVDDEKVVLDAGEQILEKLGYEVLSASGGREAVELYKDFREGIDLVLLDIVMPDMGGKEVYHKIKAINPGVKVLLSSGYSIEGKATELLDQGCNGFIQKPFNMKELSQKMKSILNHQCKGNSVTPFNNLTDNLTQ